jgi:hypothetical protein
MLCPKLEEKLRHARLALDTATGENIIALCKQYLALLAEYRAELYTLPDTLELNRMSGTSSARADVDGTRKAVRAAIEHMTRERLWVEALLLSFTAISGYGAVETFNRQKYRGHDDWKLSAGGVGFSDAAGVERMTIQESVETASLLRRNEYVNEKAAPAGSKPSGSSEDFQP